MLLNLLDGSSPLYKLSDWLSGYSDGLGEFAAEAGKYNDKRLGATLDAIYASDRHELLTSLSARAIALHEVDTGIMHNDTTTVTLTGTYERGQAEGSEVKLAHGYNKDHRPDYKQIVFGLNESADGYVPVLVQLYSGNQSDDKTHQVNWQALREFLGKAGFIYIADSKLSSTENLLMIDAAGGQFISVLPATRSEVKDYYKELGQLDPLAQAAQLPGQWPTKWKTAESQGATWFTGQSQGRTPRKASGCCGCGAAPKPPKMPAEGRKPSPKWSRNCRNFCQNSTGITSKPGSKSRHT